MRYTKNNSYFSKPTIDNCFVAGFIAADGNILTRYRRGTILSIKVKATDSIILEHIKQSIEYNGVIHNHIPKIGNPQKEIKISASQQYMIDLNAVFNITPKKSLTLKAPNLDSEDLIRSYLCGYFEGDGCLTYDSKRMIIDFSCSEDFSKWVISQIERFTTVTGNIVFQNNTYHVRYRGKKAKIVHDWMKSNSIKVLTRKWRTGNDTIISPIHV